jgi:aryl-alcohol dehydrogenase-like predicted oxidoreductase
MQAFADVVRQGKALYIGVSEWNADQIRAGHELAVKHGVQLISNQPQYSMLWRVIEQEVVPTSKQHGLGQIVWSPVAQGVLTGKYKPGAELPAGSRATDDKGGASSIQRFLTDEVLTGVAKLEPIAADLGLSMAQLAIAWVLQNDNVSSAIIGASRPEQVADNVKAAGVTLPAEVMTAIDEALGDLAETDPSKTVSPDQRPA